MRNGAVKSVGTEKRERATTAVTKTVERLSAFPSGCAWKLVRDGKIYLDLRKGWYNLPIVAYVI